MAFAWVAVLQGVPAFARNLRDWIRVRGQRDSHSRAVIILTLRHFKVSIYHVTFQGYKRIGHGNRESPSKFWESQT